MATYEKARGLHGALLLTLGFLWCNSDVSSCSYSPDITSHAILKATRFSNTKKLLWNTLKRWPVKEREEMKAHTGFLPRTPAKSFKLHTLNGVISYPSKLFSESSILFHAFNNNSAFLECMWSSKSSLNTLLTLPKNSHIIFMSQSLNATQDAKWMKKVIRLLILDLYYNSSEQELDNFKNRMHFVTTPMFELGNYLPAVFKQWSCQGHGCGFDQVVINIQDADIVLKRLDARYDWLPTFPSVYGNRTLSVVKGTVDETSCTVSCGAENSCQNHIVYILHYNMDNSTCSPFHIVSSVMKWQGLGVVIQMLSGQPIHELTCHNVECDATTLTIPAASVPYNELITRTLQFGGVQVSMNVMFQTTPSDNFYLGIDNEGLLQEMGWFLFPSFQFMVYQAQWFNYQSNLVRNLSRPVDHIIPVFNKSRMVGAHGAVSTINILPHILKEATSLVLESRFECGSSAENVMDAECAAWDRTVRMFVCCHCEGDDVTRRGLEMARWITAFRRGTGHWLTDVSPLLPLLSPGQCNLQILTDPWSQPWYITLNMRFTHNTGMLKPYKITPLFNGGTFNSSYNKNYKPKTVECLTPDVKKIELFTVITGHGSDNNGCGEFCVTSHHFLINNKYYNNITFSNAGTPLGCADRVSAGVTPNEHGTWLYGRDGWCDGQQVSPKVFDVTRQMAPHNNNNNDDKCQVRYFGWFNGSDPHPLRDPGIIIMSSYLVYYN